MIVVDKMFTSFDNFDEISMDEHLISSIPTKKNKSGLGVCAICGDKSTGINFDVLTVK